MTIKELEQEFNKMDTNELLELQIFNIKVNIEILRQLKAINKNIKDLADNIDGLTWEE
jgi:hypothetical protein